MRKAYLLALLISLSATSIITPNAAWPDVKKRAPGSLIPGGVRPGTVKALTKSECTQLGGVIDASSKACTDKGQFTCTTVTKDGAGNTRVNTVCIDNK